MRFPIVIENPPHLEAVTPDPFIPAMSQPAALLRTRLERVDDRAAAGRALDPQAPAARCAAVLRRRTSSVSVGTARSGGYDRPRHALAASVVVAGEGR